MHDRDVRDAVKRQLKLIHGDDPHTRVVEEMGIWSGTVRVDIAVINGELCGYELKSNFDTLDRLPYQAEIYGKVFDRVTLVVGDKHHEKAITRIPPWWGIVVATQTPSGVDLDNKRQCLLNPNIDATILIQLLWKNEVVAALESRGLANGWRSKRSSEICERLLSELSLHELQEEVRRSLKARTKLGQLSSREFNMPVNSVTDPTCGAPG